VYTIPNKIGGPGSLENHVLEESGGREEQVEREKRQDINKTRSLIKNDYARP